MKLNIREKIFVIGLILSLTIFLTINAVSYWNTKRHIQSRVNVEKTLVIISEYENLISMIKDAETGQRGFIITGDWTFLEPYYNGVTAVHQSMKLLRGLTPIDAQAYQELGKIEGLIEKRFEQFHETIGLRRRGGFTSVINSVMTDKDEKIMQDIRYWVEELKQEKKNLLKQLNRISKERSQHTLSTIFIGNLIALMFVLFSFFQLYRDITERKLAELALHESEEKYRAVVERAKECIAVVVDGIIRFSNSAFKSVLGYEKSEIDGMKLTMFSPPECMDAVMDRYRRRMAGEKLSPVWETKLLHKNGTKLHVESSGGYIQFEGKPADLIFIRDITGRKQVEEELRASQQLLRSLAERIEQVREEERVIISREIHDVMGGGLTGLKMDLSWLKHKVENGESEKEQAAMSGRIITSIESADQMIKVTRRISTELRPPVLDDLGLIAALEWQLSDFTSHTGILHQFTTAFEDVIMDSKQAVTVFRIFQETLTNIARHSGATKVVVVLGKDGRSISGDENLVLEIRDNGSGIKEDKILNSKSLGLLGMKERAMAFGGEFSIFGEPGGGTAVSIKIPRNLGGMQ
jgi:PAS domain S-box-containing protein